MAPEIVSKVYYEAFQADVWALGVVLYAMLTGEFPFKGKTDRELYSRICGVKIVYPESVPVGGQKLMERIFQFDPKHRLSCKEVRICNIPIDHERPLAVGGAERVSGQPVAQQEQFHRRQTHLHPPRRTVLRLLRTYLIITKEQSESNQITTRPTPVKTIVIDLSLCLYHFSCT